MLLMLDKYALLWYITDMKRLVKALWRHKIRTSIVGIILIYATTAIVSANHQYLLQQQAAQAAAQLAAQKTACTLDPTTFLNTVNQWRSAAHEQPLQYSTQLQQDAQARIVDMQQYQYWGHTNPQTKQDNGYFTQKYDPAATWWDEVLDGPSNASQSLTDFKNSQPHYTALMDSRENYIGLVAEYLPESWGVYDNTGKLITNAGVNHSNCIVLADLANNIGQAPPVSQTPSAPINSLSPAQAWYLQQQGIIP
jgi:uncharacterized protein YkwD